MSEELWRVFLYGLLTAAATGLGAIPFAFVNKVSARTIGGSNAIASGLMLGASLGLVLEGGALGPGGVAIGGASGLAFVLLAQRWMRGREVTVGDLRGVDARKAALLLIVMTVHSFSEGVAVGVSFGGEGALAVPITLAIAVHNIPEGLAISAVLRPRGTSLLGCALWSIVSSLPQPLMAIPAYLFVDRFAEALPYGLGFAAGAMVYVVFRELLPEAYGAIRPTAVGFLVVVSMLAIVLFQIWLS